MLQMGPFNLFNLIINILNALIKKGVFSMHESREILKSSMADDISDTEKEKILDDMKK